MISPPRAKKTPPEWYTFLQIAKYLSCRPDEVEEMPVEWVDRVLMAMQAEHDAEPILRERAKIEAERNG